ncbi:hypothetical protein HDU92_004690, partial [Lobulomyces angularis]
VIKTEILLHSPLAKTELQGTKIEMANNNFNDEGHALKNKIPQSFSVSFAKKLTIASFFKRKIGSSAAIYLVNFSRTSRNCRSSNFDDKKTPFRALKQPEFEKVVKVAFQINIQVGSSDDLCNDFNKFLILDANTKKSIPKPIKYLKIKYFPTEGKFKIIPFPGDHVIKFEGKIISNATFNPQDNLTLNNESKFSINDMKFQFFFPNNSTTNTDDFNNNIQYNQLKLNNLHLSSSPNSQKDLTSNINNSTRHKELIVDISSEPPKMKQSWIKLLRQVFYESGLELLKLKQIYEIALKLQPDLEEITSNGKQNSNKWKNAIRHTLSISPWFTKSGSGNGKFGYWCLSATAKLKMNQDSDADVYSTGNTSDVEASTQPIYPIPSSFYSSENLDSMKSSTISSPDNFNLVPVFGSGEVLGGNIDFGESDIVGKVSDCFSVGADSLSESGAVGAKEYEQYRVEIVNEDLCDDFSDECSSGSMEARKGDRSPFSLPSSANTTAPPSVRGRKPNLRIDTQSAAKAIKFNDIELWTPQTFNESCLSYINSRLQEGVTTEIGQQFTYPTPIDSEHNTPPYSPNPSSNLFTFSQQMFNQESVPGSPFLHGPLSHPPFPQTYTDFASAPLAASLQLNPIPHSPLISAPMSPLPMSPFLPFKNDSKSPLISPSMSPNPYMQKKKAFMRSNQHDKLNLLKNKSHHNPNFLNPNHLNNQQIPNGYYHIAFG